MDTLYVNFYLFMPVYERTHREIVGQLPGAEQDRYILEDPSNWEEMLWEDEEEKNKKRAEETCAAHMDSGGAGEPQG